MNKSLTAARTASSYLYHGLRAGLTAGSIWSLVTDAVRDTGRTQEIHFRDGRTVRSFTPPWGLWVCIVLKREYNPPGFEIPAGGIVIDVGANSGVFSIFASSIAERVLAVEPDPNNFRDLTRNLLAFDCHNVIPLNCAVGSGAPVTLWENYGGGTASTVVRTNPLSQGRTVASLPLEEIMGQQGIDVCHFLKLDCEGAEFEIVEHLPAGRVEKIAMEYHEVIEGRTWRWLRDKLSASGFTTTRAIPSAAGQREGMLFAARQPA